MNMGNGFGIPNVMFNFGANHDNYISTDSSDDSSSSSSISDSEPENLMDSKGHYRQRPSQPFKGKNLLSSDLKLSYETVQKIENDLDFYEVVSLVFLLYDKCEALTETTAMLEEGPSGFARNRLSNWAHANTGNWTIMLIEALAVIQNYKILEKLGYSKEEIDEHFHPMLDSALHLDRVKKALYRFCEFLTIEQARKLIRLVYVDEQLLDSTMSCNAKYLEFYLLTWISREYMQIDNIVDITNLTKHFKKMDLLEKERDLNCFVNRINEERKKTNVIQSKRSKSINEHQSNVYPIKDPQNVGLIIIVNNTEFLSNIDKRPEMKNELPDPHLQDRKGSLRDVQQLIKIFTMLNFTIVELKDIKDYEFKPKIETAIKTKFIHNVHSMLFLCVLSHGAEGVVYGVNSITVSIYDIENIVSGPESLFKNTLRDIPKVLIIQACQGDKPLCVEELPLPKSSVCEPDTCHQLLSTDGNLHFDGSFGSPKPFADVLICMAIIEGYFAVRSTREGTKYIQTLCKKIEQFYKIEHFVDIVTRVHNELNNEQMHVKNVPDHLKNCNCSDSCVCVYMTPTLRHTLVKSLFLVRREE